MDYKLYIGNKNYSTWSMRVWVVMKYFDIAFDEKMIRFDSFSDTSTFKKVITKINAFGTVPVLIDADVVINDSLAISEYLAEKHSDLPLWPRAKKQKALARCLTAQMHSGYNQIRNYFPMNIEASFAEIGQIILRDNPDVNREIEFFNQYISSILVQSPGNYLCGDFSIVDAFYAPMCIRLKNFNIEVSSVLARYIDIVLQTKGVKHWIEDALMEHDFIPMDEPYRLHR